MGGVPIGPKLMRYFNDHMGVRVFVDQIAKDLNETEPRIKGGIATLRRTVDEWASDLHVDARGQAWTYKPTNKQETKDDGKRVFAELGVSVAGEIVIQDTNGKLYKAVEL